MASKFEFDETRAAIGADALDASERKAMLQRFQDAGGKVLTEKELRQKAALEAEARSAGGGAGSGGMSRERGAPSGVKLPSEMAREKARAEADRIQRAKNEWESALKNISGPGSKLIIRFRCLLAGLTPFSRAEIKPSFLSFLNIELKQALVEMNLLGNDLFLQRPSVGRKITQNLDNKNPLLMETLEAAHRLYEAEVFARIAPYGQNNSMTKLELVQEPLKALYRKLYILYPFQETLRKAMMFALDTFRAEATGVSVESMKALAIKEKRFFNNMKAIFQQAYPKLFQLICRADNADYPPMSPLLERAIGISNDMKLGKRQKGEMSALGSEKEDESPDEQAAGESTAENPEEEKKEDKKSKTGGIYDTKEYQYGMSLMKLRLPPELIQRYDPKKRFADQLPINDKVLLSYLYFLDFDFEYSFVLTTNKIKVNVDYSGGVKTDYRKNMTDVYNDSRGIMRTFEKYLEMVEELKKVKERKISNYIEQQKLEDKAKGRVDTEARNIRGMIRSYMDAIARAMGIFIADMKGPKAIVGNMNDIIKFDSDLEKGKKLNGKTVIQCIMDAYCVAIAFRERMTDGDFYGGIIEMTDEEMADSFGSTFKTE